jgi:hypothetical protein
MRARLQIRCGAFQMGDPRLEAASENGPKRTRWGQPIANSALRLEDVPLAEGSVHDIFSFALTNTRAWEAPRVLDAEECLSLVPDWPG